MSEMTVNTILIILAALFGLAYFAKRSARKQRELKSHAKRSRAL
jgi:hypothetical protein